jgi:hypothetical protein
MMIASVLLVLLSVTSHGTIEESSVARAWYEIAGAIAALAQIFGE